MVIPTDAPCSNIGTTGVCARRESAHAHIRFARPQALGLILWAAAIEPLNETGSLRCSPANILIPTVVLLINCPITCRREECPTADGRTRPRAIERGDECLIGFLPRGRKRNLGASKTGVAYFAEAALADRPQDLEVVEIHWKKKSG